MLLDFFENLGAPTIKAVTLQNFMLLKRHQRNVDHDFWTKQHNLKPLNQSELGLLVGLQGFFAQFERVGVDAKRVALRRIYLALHKDTEHYKDCFFGRDLIGIDFENNW